MKNLITICYILTTFLCGLPNKAFSNQITGGDIYYKQTDNHTYVVYGRIYWNCKGDGAFTPPPATLPLCISNTCTSFTATSTLKLQPGSYEVPTPCANMQTTCTSPSATLPGYMFCTYTDTVTTPFRCNYWKFSTYFDHRDFAINGPPPSVNFYMDATLNDSGSFYVNSFPATNTHGNLFIPFGEPIYYNCAVFDINNDSITAEIVNPLTSGLTCNSSTAVMPFTTKVPALNLTSNPFQTNNSFTLDAQTGDMNFIPTELGQHLLAVRLRKYRSGKLIGASQKEICYHVMPNKSATNPVLSVTSYSGCTYSGNKIYVCPNQSFSFTADIKTASPGGIYLVSDNHNLFAPSATVIYTNQGTDSVHAVFFWTSTSKIYAEYNLAFIIKDSTCTTPGIPYYRTVVIPIVILGKPTALNDTSICTGTSATLRSKGGGNYTWSIINGTPGSLSCSSCSTTTATPTVTSQYLLTSLAGAACGSNKDTVTVTVKPITVPSVSIAADHGPVIVEGNSVTFSATATNCVTSAYMWKVNGTIITGATGSTYTTSTLKNGDKVTCELNCLDDCPNPKNSSSNQITLQVIPLSISNTGKANNIFIVPNPNNGTFTLLGLNNTNGTVDVINMLGEKVYSGNTNQTTIDLGNVANGIYLLRISQEDETITLRFTIDK